MQMFSALLPRFFDNNGTKWETLVVVCTDLIVPQQCLDLEVDLVPGCRRTVPTQFNFAASIGSGL